MAIPPTTAMWVTKVFSTVPPELTQQLAGLQDYRDVYYRVCTQCGKRQERFGER